MWILDILWENKIPFSKKDDLLLKCISNHHCISNHECISNHKKKQSYIPVIEWLLHHFYPVSCVDLCMCIHKKHCDLYFILFEHCKKYSLFEYSQEEYQYLIRYSLEYKLEDILFHLYEHPELYIKHKENDLRLYTNI